MKLKIENKSEESKKKDTYARIEEVVNIRKQLQNAGVFIIPKNEEIFREKSHDFIKEGYGSTFTLTIPATDNSHGVRFEVILATKKQTKSGVVLL